jgi:polyphosphate kinase
MMHRNLDRRIEALIHITDPAHIEQLNRQLDRGMSDQVQSWALLAEGTWERRAHSADGELRADVQHETMMEIMQRKRGVGKR